MLYVPCAKVPNGKNKLNKKIPITAIDKYLKLNLVLLRLFPSLKQYTPF